MSPPTFAESYRTLKKSGKHRDARQLLKARAYWSPALFAKTFLSHHVAAPFGTHHYQIFNALPHGSIGKKINIVAPRGSAKSTLMTVIYPIYRICYVSYDAVMLSEGHQREHFILIVSKSYNMAAQRVRSIQSEFESNEKLKLYFGELRGQKTWGVQSLVTANGVQITPQGRGGQVRGSLFEGHRPSLIICDDLDDPETVNNPEVREKDLKWFNDDLLRAGSLDGSTNFVNIDTIKHKKATTSLLRDRPGWQTLYFQAIRYPPLLWHPTAEDTWKKWESLWTDRTLSATERTSGADAFYQANKAEMHGDEIKELWPQMMTYLDVRKEICDVGYASVMRELQNNPVDRGQSLFDMAGSLRFSVVAEGFLRSDNRLVKWREMAGATVFLDWAGGKDLSDNCFACVVGVVWVPLPGGRGDKTDSLMGGTNGYVLFDWLEKVGPTEQVAACFDMIEKIRATIPVRDFSVRLGIEGFVQDTWQAQKEMIQRDYTAQKEKRHMRDAPSISWLQRLKNKYDRIDALQPPIYNRWLGFCDKLSREFMEQMSDYPTGDFLDAPDALEGACQLRVSRFESERRANREAARRKNQNFKFRL